MRTLFLLCLALALVSCTQSHVNQRLNYPIAKKVDTVDTYFGIKVADPYRWLENDSSLETSEWVKAENVVTFSYLNSIPFRSKIKARLTKMWDYEKVQTPEVQGSNLYYFKNNGLQNQDILYVADRNNQNTKIFFDPNKLSTDGTIALSQHSFSKNHKYFGYALSHSGSDWKEIKVINTETGQELNDIIKWAKFTGISWFKEGFFYSRYEEPKKGKELSNLNEGHKVYYHKLGTNQTQDQLYYENKKFVKRNYGAGVSEDEKILFLTETESTTGNSLYYKDLTKLNAQFVKLADGFNYDFSPIGHVNGIAYVLTNYKAPKYKVIAIDLLKPDSLNWVDVIPQSEGVIESCGIGSNHLIVQFMKDVHSQLRIYNLKGEPKTKVLLPTIGSITDFSCNNDDSILYYTFSSYNFPQTVFKYNIKENAITTFFKPKLEFDELKYETRQLFCKSKDGTEFPIDIVYKKGLELNGNNPVLMYGYGGFNVTYKPDFKIGRVIWLENGGIYVNVHMRGGGEYGEDWHKAGTLLNKQNVFDDFIAAAEFLINEKYTNNKKIAINGGSNGGLLIGAVLNQRPDLFKVAIPEVGVMDMLRYQKFTIGWAWATDYGTSDDSLQFLNLLKYSPLHTIKESVEYPATLIITADHDDRVVPAHSFKYAATLQEKYKGTNPTIIRIETKAGHGSGKSTKQRIEEATDKWAFVFQNLGMEPEY